MAAGGGRRSCPPPVDSASLFWLVPVLLYLGAGLCQVTPLFWPDRVAEAVVAGRHWRARDLRETAVVVMAATMLATSVLALLRWADRRWHG